MRSATSFFSVSVSQQLVLLQEVFCLISALQPLTLRAIGSAGGACGIGAWTPSPLKISFFHSPWTQRQRLTLPRVNFQLHSSVDPELIPGPRKTVCYPTECH